MNDDIKYNSEALRAKDIIPLCGPKPKQAGPTNSSVPRFDLATEIMAQQRKLTSSRRKSPESTAQTFKDEFYTKLPAASAAVFPLRISACESVIVEIVRADIRKMLPVHGGPQT